MATYLALLRKDRDSDFGVELPDFPGCVTAGSTLDEARANAEEALQLHIEGMMEDGAAIPAPSRLDDVEPRELADAVAYLVSVPEPQPKVVRVNITVPEDLLRAMDAYAEAMG